MKGPGFYHNVITWILYKTYGGVFQSPINYVEVLLFELPDRRLGVPSIAPTSNGLYLFTQGSFCLALENQPQLKQQDRMHIIRTDCTYTNKESFRVKELGVGGAFQLIVDGLCLSTSPGVEPKQGALVAVLPCRSGDEFETWRYDLQLKRIFLVSYPHLCLDYGASWFGTGAFGVWTCWEGAINLNQVINIENCPAVVVESGSSVLIRLFSALQSSVFGRAHNSDLNIATVVGNLLGCVLLLVAVGLVASRSLNGRRTFRFLNHEEHEHQSGVCE